MALMSFSKMEKCTGVVKDVTGETVIGASVVVKGTSNGTITDINGSFFCLGKKGDIIQISFYWLSKGGSSME